MLVQSFMVMFAMPAVMIASTVMLLNDRTIGTHFVNPAEGGDPLLYQHVFWFFGHPEVYIIFLPALGMVSAIIETHSRRAIFGYPAMVSVAGRERLHRFRTVGAPHVRNGSAADRRSLFHSGQHDDRGYQRHPDLLLARNAVDRPAYV